MKINELNLRNLVKLRVVCLTLISVVLLSCSQLAKDSLSCSVEVKNKAATKAIGSGDVVELYIRTFAYVHEKSPKWMIIVAGPDNGMTDKIGQQIINDGWFNAKAEVWENQSDRTSGDYSSIMIAIDTLKVNNTKYIINMGGGHILFGKTQVPKLANDLYLKKYPDNFNGIVMPSNPLGLKTILTIDPNIIGTPNTAGYDEKGLATDPFLFIKIEGIVL